MNATFRYETPVWGARLVCAVYFLVSALLLYASYTYEQWSGSSPVAFKYFLLALGFVFLLLSVKPGNHKGWVYFSADKEGMYFPSSPLGNGGGSCLHVKWADVGKIQRETLYGGRRGLSVELFVTQLEVDSCFKGSGVANKILGFDQKRSGFFVVAFADNAFQKISDVVSTLNAMKGASR